MEKAFRISEAAKRLGVTPHHLRVFEWKQVIPPVQRDYNGRVYTEFDIALLRAMGVGRNPRRLKRPEDALKAAR